MPHLELGSDHTSLHKAALIHNAKEAEEDEEARRFAMEPVVAPKKKEPRPVAPEVTYTPENLTEDPAFEKFLKVYNDAILAMIDSFKGLANYIKKLEEFYKTVKKEEIPRYHSYGVEEHYKHLYDYVKNTSKDYVIPMYNVSYEKSKEAWHRRVLGYIQAVKDFDIEEEAPAPPPPKKVKKITISGVRHSYKEGKIDGANVLIIYKDSDEKLEHPMGYLKWDMEKNRPSGKLLPLP